ncbi:hypothetical protein DJ572_03250 [Bacillus subtilis]|nr:hypothetical protein DJ572_03250 [Bacillus subtilis]
MRCAIYIRVSTDKEEQKASLKYQKELFYKFIEKKDGTSRILRRCAIRNNRKEKKTSTND